MQYKITVTVDAGNAIDSIGAVCRQMNDALSTWGIHERLHLRMTIPLVLTCNRKLTPKEKVIVKRLLLQQWRADRPGDDPEVLAMRLCKPPCKSGNVQRSVE